MTIKARVHPVWAGGKAGYLYSVIYDGKLLIERSRDPEHDAARALHAMGLTGKLTLLDGKSGVPRSVVDIERAAKLTMTERIRGGLSAVAWVPFSDAVLTHTVEPYSDESDAA